MAINLALRLNKNSPHIIKSCVLSMMNLATIKSCNFDQMLIAHESVTVWFVIHHV